LQQRFAFILAILLQIIAVPFANPTDVRNLDSETLELSTWSIKNC